MTWLKRKISSWLELDKFALRELIAQDHEIFLDKFRELRKRDIELAQFLCAGKPNAEREKIIQRFGLRSYRNDND